MSAREERMRRYWRKRRGESFEVAFTKPQLNDAFAHLDALKPQLAVAIRNAVDGAIPGISMLEAALIFDAWVQEELYGN